LYELEQYIKNVSRLDSGQSEVLSGQIKYLIDSSSRLTIKDWKLVFAGLIAGWISNNVLPNQEAFNGFMKLTMSLFSWVFHSIPFLK
jgi:hypothetical protein